MKLLGYFSAAAWLVYALCSTAELQAKSTAPASPRQQEVEQQLQQLQKDIQALQDALTAARSDHKTEQEQLKKLDLSIQQSSQAIRALKSQLLEQTTELAQLEEERQQQLQRLNLDQQQLAEQVSDTYRLTRQSRLKLIFNQDDATQLGRMLAYFEHINRIQSDRIEQLRQALDSLEAIYQRIELQLQAIDSARQSQQQELQLKEQQRTLRQTVLAGLLQQIGSGEAQLKEFEQNRQDLEKLLEKLSDVLADIPSNLGHQVSVGAKKGQLAAPVKAKVRKAFGQKRGGGMYWQGWVFDAQPGSEVSSIAYGRVAFSDWLRGYGLMIIIDHGEGFMSLYGYNESLLWEVGDWVEPGSIIATVGSNNAGEQGLYFELRKDGKALDPAAWLER